MRNHFLHLSRHAAAKAAHPPPSRHQRRALRRRRGLRARHSRFSPRRRDPMVPSARNGRPPPGKSTLMKIIARPYIRLLRPGFVLDGRENPLPLGARRTRCRHCPWSIRRKNSSVRARSDGSRETCVLGSPARPTASVSCSGAAWQARGREHSRDLQSTSIRRSRLADLHDWPGSKLIESRPRAVLGARIIILDETNLATFAARSEKRLFFATSCVPVAAIRAPAPSASFHKFHRGHPLRVLSNL